jgi:hypothetical protein
LEIDTAGVTCTDADTAILHGLLGLSHASLDRCAASPALRKLAHDGLPWGAELTQVTEDVHHAAHRLENKVLRVTRDGKTVWERPVIV